MSNGPDILKDIYGMNNRIIEAIVAGKYADADYYAHEIKETIDRTFAGENIESNETQEDVLSKILNMPEQLIIDEKNLATEKIEESIATNKFNSILSPSIEKSESINVLVVDDNELNLEIAETILKNEGYHVMLADNARRAITIFANSLAGDIQVILTDIQMPGMDGNEMAKEIRSFDHPDAKKVQIIALSAARSETEIKASFNAGMNGFIKKPFDIAQFKRIIAGAR